MTLRSFWKLFAERFIDKAHAAVGFLSEKLNNVHEKGNSV